MRFDPAAMAICRSARAGNMDDFAQLRVSRQSLVRAILQRYAYAVPPQDMDDLEQEVWIAVWSSLPRFEGRSAFDTWLISLTRNVFRGWLRHKSVREAALLRLRELDELYPAETEKSNPSERLSLKEEIDRLPRREQEVIELRYFMQLTDQEIAARLQMPLGTVKSRLRRGLGHLRRFLGNAAMTDPRTVAPESRVKSSRVVAGVGAFASRAE